MLKSKKLLIIGIISFSLIISSIFYIIILSENNLTSTSRDNDSETPQDPLILENTPKGVRLTLIHNYNDSIIISWYTEKSATDPNLVYSTNAALSSAIEITPNSTQITSTTFIYYAEIVNLLPNTTYHYQVSSDDNNKREIMNFTTLANKDVSNITFLVYGDSRTQRLERRILAEKIMESFRNKFEFIVHTGDIVEDGIDQNEWNNYFSDTEVLNAYKQGVYVEGNHERGNSNTKMYDNLLMYGTQNNRYYYFSYGGIGFIILNSNSYTVGDDDQTNWLNNTLIQISQKNSYNFAFLHHPLLHSRSYDYHREQWRPLFDKYNITCVFCGHNHHYERSYPMTNSSKLEYDNSERYNYTNLNESIYIVTGGAGAPLYEVNNDNFVAKSEKAYHFLLVDVKKESTKTSISLESWGMPNDFGALYLIDNITLTKFI